MSVSISPDVLVFNAPYTEQQKITELNIANNSDETIAFKVKTTTPQKYCVKPNSAILKARSSQVVQIVYLGNDNALLQAHDLKTPYSCKDKFLVQTLPCPYEFDDIHKGWSSLESEFKGLLEAKKIRVKFDFKDPETLNATTKEVPAVLETNQQKAQTIPEIVAPVASEDEEKAQLEVVNPIVAKEAEPVEEPILKESDDGDESENRDIVEEIIQEKKNEVEEERDISSEKTPVSDTQAEPQAGPDLIGILAVIGVIIAAYLAYKKIQ